MILICIPSVQLLHQLLVLFLYFPHFHLFVLTFMVFDFVQSYCVLCGYDV